ncbi:MULTISPECIES: LysR family transcriptional regulator [Paenibacillus]|uniref:LysR family transcriptional regulator n=1 Tax=Paenibacillus TaxID=44249 RepID=UPI0022B88ABF|nr:LysR family transcriptional regulator [Paenibacillus caseinilyticus]MCZ8521922.1 LysR family transcriptional regulator [Paenibacillus caseinilyticus]
MSQPPLSQQLKLLENELGVALFERRGRSLHLTEPGRVLYGHALRITKLMEQARGEVGEIGRGTRGKFILGINTLSDFQLPLLLRSFKETYPEVTYKIQQNESAQLCKLLRDREIELAIVRLPVPLTDFSLVHLGTEPFYPTQARIPRLQALAKWGMDHVFLRPIRTYVL